MDREKPKIKKTGIIILGHGSRLKKANNIIGDIIKLVKKTLILGLVEPAYLQLSCPSLSKSIKHLVSKNCQRIIIVPFFLFNGNHVSRDLPNMVRKEQLRYPDLDLLYTKNLAEKEKLGRIVIDRIREVWPE